MEKQVLKIKQDGYDGKKLQWRRKAKTNTGEEISCPSWSYPEDRENILITVEDGETLKITEEEVPKLLEKNNEKN